MRTRHVCAWLFAVPHITWALRLERGTELQLEFGALPECYHERLQSTKMETIGGHSDPLLKEAGIDAIYVPHYTHLKTRRKYLENLFNDQHLQGHVITGWDREDFTDDDVACLYPSNQLFQKVAKERDFPINWFSTGELSCAVKHAAAWYDAVRKGHRNFLVLEDDTIVEENFKHWVAWLVSNQTMPPYDVFFIGRYYENKNLSMPRHIKHDPSHGKGSGAYLVSQQGARWMVDHLPLTGPADHMLSNEGSYPNPPPVRYNIQPWLAWQGSRVPEWRMKYGDDGGLKGKGKTYIRTEDMEPCSGCGCPKLLVNTSRHMLTMIMTAETTSQRAIPPAWSPLGPTVRLPGKQEGVVLDVDLLAQDIDEDKACDFQGALEYEQRLMDASMNPLMELAGAAKQVR